MVRSDVDICGTKEKLNVITVITKGMFMKNNESGESLNSDGFSVDIDINTVPENTGLRFSSNSLKDFVLKAIDLRNNVLENIG